VSISQLVGNVVASAGYPAVFGLVGLESLGIPLPGETAVVAASIYAGNTHRLSPWLIFAAAACAAVIGDNIGFWIGSAGGYRLARRYGSKVRLDDGKLKVAHYLSDRHGAKLVFFGRFISVLRAYAAFLAGTTKMRWPRFLPANAAGGIVWAAAYTSAGYLAGAALQHLSLTIALVLGGVAVLVIALLVLVTRRRLAELTERAEKAYPGPLE
jgi:membrane protein DedA with SNARE-associated domain